MHMNRLNIVEDDGAGAAAPGPSDVNMAELMASLPEGMDLSNPIIQQLMQATVRFLLIGVNHHKRETDSELGWCGCGAVLPNVCAFCG